MKKPMTPRRRKALRKKQRKARIAEREQRWFDGYNENLRALGLPGLPEANQ